MYALLIILSFALIDFIRGRGYVPRLYCCLAMAAVCTISFYFGGVSFAVPTDNVKINSFLLSTLFITLSACLYFGYMFADSKFFSASTGVDNRKEPGTFLGNLFSNLIVPNPVTKSDFRRWGIAGQAGGHIQRFSLLFITLFAATGSIIPLIAWPFIGLSGFIYGAGRYDKTGSYRFVEPARGALLGILIAISLYG